MLEAHLSKHENLTKKWQKHPGVTSYTIIGERVKPHTNWSKWKIAIFICYTYITQNAHALTHAHEIATKQRHNKQSFSLSHTIVASIMEAREPENKQRRPQNTR